MRKPGISSFSDRFGAVIVVVGLFLAVLAVLAPAAGAGPWDPPEHPGDAPLPRSARLPRPTPSPADRAAALARLAPDDPARPALTLGLGVAEVLSGQPGPGADRLAGLQGQAGDLAGVAAYYRGLGLYLDGRPDQAREVLAPLAGRVASDFLGRDALYLGLECAARQGDAAGAMSLATDWLASPDPSLAPEVWLRAAVAANALGDGAKARDFLRHLSLAAPWTRAAKAGDALARDLCAAGRAVGAAPSADETGCYDPDAPGNLLMRAEGLAEHGQAEAALGLLGGLAGADAGQLARADYVRGKALYALRRTQAARQAFAKAVAAGPDAALAPWARYHEARCLWRSLDRQDHAAMEALLVQVLAAPARDDRVREAAARHLALVRLERGRFAEALDAARQLSGLAVSPDLAAQGSSLVAILRLAVRDFAGAEADLAAFAARFPDDDWADGARYFRGRALAALGREVEAATLWAELAAGRPNTYYGWRAARALEALPAAIREAAPRPAPAPDRPRCPDTPEPPDPAAEAVLATAGTLRRAGLPVLAEMLLDFAARQAPRRGDLALAHIEAALATGRRAAIARTAWRTFGGCLLRGTAAELAPLRRALYPREYAEVVRTALAGSGLDPDILYSLIRQESFFDPQAVSGAGAVGLTQMLPDTAKAVARRLGLKTDRLDLTDPDLNIRLGAAYFLERLRRAGNLPAALAGYNAGENRVALWREALEPLGEELFIECIPYTETRDYVRRILANAAMYGRLYAGPGQ